MRRAPIATLLGPALVLYLIADAAAAQGELDPVGALVAFVAAALSLSRIAVGRDADLPGARAVAWLGLLLGLALVRVAAPGALALPVDVAQVVALSGVALLLVELATGVPDAVLGVGRRVRRALRLLSVAVAVVGLAALAPAVRVAGVDWLLPAAWAHAPVVYVSAALVVALALRLSRRRLGSSPEALASNTWAVFALLPAVAVAAGGWLWAWLGAGLDVAALRIGLCLSAAVLFWGHLRLTDPSRRLGVGPATRDAVAATLTLALAAGTAVQLRALWPSEPLPLLLSVTAGLLAVVGLYRLLREATRLLLAPFAGRLLAAVEAGHRALAGTRSLQELAEHALGAVRRAAGDLEGEPVLYVLDPRLELRLDAAGRAHGEAGGAPHPELLRALAASPGEIIVAAPLEAQVVRNPPLRPLIDALVQLDALCVVPLVVDGELEGALVVPRGRRRSTPNLEELEALHGLARHVAGYLSVLTAQQRAQARAGELLHGRRRAEAEVARLGDALGRVQAEARALRAGGSLEQLDSPELIYSQSMRALQERLESAASMDVPLLLVAERGVDLLPLCRRVHQLCGGGDRPFVLGACAEVQPDGSASALFGREGTGGWLSLAAGGELVLTDLPALGAEAQAQLAAALQGGGAGARVIGTARLDPDQLVEHGALDAELRERFPLVLRVPPLRERTEDLPSLTLLAIDRACRVLGKATVGIDPAAQARLAEHGWPGNAEELRAVIERAVARCQGARITVGDLPELGPAVAAGSAEHPLDGSLESVEARVLAHALERAGGNRSEAARLLGLKRTTFLDKLRRHGLEDSKRSRASVAPPN